MERSITVEQSTKLRHALGITAVLAAAVILAGCESGGPPPTAKRPTEKGSAAGVAGQPGRKPQREPAAKAEPKPEPTAESEPGVPRTEAQSAAKPQGAVAEGLGGGRESGPAAETKSQPEPEPLPAPRAKSEPEPEPTPEPEPKTEPAAKSQPTEPTQPEPESATPEAHKTPDLGPPLVKDVKDLIRLDKTRPVWIDKANKRIVMVGQVCQRSAPLELFACLKNTKDYEAVVSVDVEAATVHAGLLAVGAKAGHPARWNPNYVPATGTEIEVTVVWKDKDGKPQTARAQDWVLDIQTKKAMTYPWVFAGSGFWKDEETGRKYYLAEGGDFICVSNFPSAMMDLPIESSQSNDALMFRPFTERIPPLGTPVTLLLTPKPEKDEKAKQKDAPEPAEKTTA
jgi:hypothetical protein